MGAQVADGHDMVVPLVALAVLALAVITSHMGVVAYEQGAPTGPVVSDAVAPSRDRPRRRPGRRIEGVLAGSRGLDRAGQLDGRVRHPGPVTRPVRDVERRVGDAVQRLRIAAQHLFLRG